MSKFDQELIQELQQAGETKAMIRPLLSVAKKLSQAPALTRSASFKKSQAKRLAHLLELPYTPWYRQALVPASALMVLMITVTSVAAAQQSFPGDTLYPLKRWSEKTAIIFKPDFQTQIPVRRSEEVKFIVEQKRDPELLKSTLSDYKEEIVRSRDQASERSTRIEQSVSNLEEAKTSASQEDRQEIDQAISVVRQPDQGGTPNPSTPAANQPGTADNGQNGDGGASEPSTITQPQNSNPPAPSSGDNAGGGESIQPSH